MLNIQIHKIYAQNSLKNQNLLEIHIHNDQFYAQILENSMKLRKIVTSIQMKRSQHNVA